MNIQIIELPEAEYITKLETTFKHRNLKYKGSWFKDAQGFMTGSTVYINQDAFFLFPVFSKLMLIAHEIGHIRHKKHTWKNPIMWKWGILRP